MCKLRTPNPPFSLGLVTLCNAMSADPLSSFPYFLQKQSLIYLLICSIMLAGMDNVHMKNVGRLLNTDLINVSFSPCNINVEQPDNLLSILCIMGIKSFF